jgi:hypothetical protein
LREALAHSDHDFVVAEPRRRKPQPKAQQRRGFVWFAAAIVRMMFRLAAYPNRILGGLVFAVVIAIAVNALLLQHSRHPAPLFHRPVADDLHVPATQTAQTIVRTPLAPLNPVPVDAPKPAPQPTNSDQIGQLLTTDGPSQSSGNDAGAPQTAPVPLTAPAPQPTKHDAIAHLLAVPAAHEASRESVTKDATAHDVPADEQPKTILAVQRALVKLGYVVRPDGEMGAVTRHALAQYERDHGLPADPHLTAKLLHRLSTETGMAME